ncbi:MAG: L-2-amino-thiazoline-4-carboxylic acid hydrolase [Anaerolineae bacterium]
MSEIMAKLYYHLAKEMLDSFGAEGEAALRRAVRAFGRDRGATLRQRHMAQNLPINLKTLFQHYDLPGTESSRFRRTTFRLDEDTRQSETYECHFCDVWNDLGGEQALRTLGQIYCNEFHQAMWGEYDSDIHVDLPRLLTLGDPHCRFEVHRTKAK